MVDQANEAEQGPALLNEPRPLAQPDLAPPPAQLDLAAVLSTLPQPPALSSIIDRGKHRNALKQELLDYKSDLDILPFIQSVKDTLLALPSHYKMILQEAIRKLPVQAATRLSSQWATCATRPDLTMNDVLAFVEQMGHTVVSQQPAHTILHHLFMMEQREGQTAQIFNALWNEKHAKVTQLSTVGTAFHAIAAMAYLGALRPEVAAMIAPHGYEPGRTLEQYQQWALSHDSRLNKRKTPLSPPPAQLSALNDTAYHYSDTVHQRAPRLRGRGRAGRQQRGSQRRQFDWQRVSASSTSARPNVSIRIITPC